MQTVLDIVAGPGFQQSDVPDLTGMTVLVTGGTGGLGFEVAKTCALHNARVLLLSRKTEHGDEAIRQIKEAASGTVDVEFIKCDLGSLKSVKEVADKIRNEEKRLNILIAGAGVGVNKFDVSADGIDRHFAVNYLGHYLLINRLMPLIRRTDKDLSQPAPRIVSISSELHRAASSSIKFASPAEITEEAKDYSANNLYARTKLALILFTKFGLVERVIQPTKDARILALTTHPGAVATGQQEQFKEAYGQVLGSVMKAVTVPFFRTPEQGSLSTLWAATSDKVDKSMQGYYFSDPETPGEETEQARDKQLGQNLWDVSEQLVKEKLGPDGLLPWDEEM
ncbi:hypothetical protein HWV62_2848 [Athelia sp. TMB]|nr:hypothetical protein HWV62_2848 [Athelia sp. TMB]